MRIYKRFGRRNKYKFKLFFFITSDSDGEIICNIYSEKKGKEQSTLLLSVIKFLKKPMIIPNCHL